MNGSNIRKVTPASDQIVPPTAAAIGSSANAETSSAREVAAVHRAPFYSSDKEEMSKKPTDTDTFYNNMLTILSPQRLITRKKLKSDIRQSKS